MESSRRDLLKLGAAIMGVTAAMAAGINMLRAAEPGEKRGDMIYRKLGRTGESVSLIGLGGFHIGTVEDEAEAIKIIAIAVLLLLIFKLYASNLVPAALIAGLAVAALLSGIGILRVNEKE